MKNKLIITGLLCAIALAGLLTITKVPAQGNPHQSHAVVILGYKQLMGELVNTGNGGYQRQIGLVVHWVSRSEGAPEINIDSSLSEASTYLLNNKFHLEQSGIPGQLIFVR